MKEILAKHESRHPEWELADLYKLIYQAAMGPEHALSDEAQTRKLLLQEISQLQDGPDEPLAEKISPDGRLARVHLRPFIKQGHEPELLLKAFLASAHTFLPSRDKLVTYAGKASEAACEGKIHFTQSMLQAHIAKLGAAGFPPLHHSDKYRRLYRPAYRIVLAEHIPECCASGRRSP